MIFECSRRPKLIQPGSLWRPGCRLGAPPRLLAWQSPTPVHLRVVGEHHFRRRPLFRLVEHEGHGPVDMPADPHAGSVRAFRRAEDAADQQPPARADRRALPFRPCQLPPPVLRRLPQFALARPDLLRPDVQRHVVELTVPLEPVAVVDHVDELERRVRAPEEVVRPQGPAQERLHLVWPRRHVVAARRAGLPAIAAPFPLAPSSSLSSLPCADAQGLESSRLDNARKLLSKFTVADHFGPLLALQTLPPEDTQPGEWACKWVVYTIPISLTILMPFYAAYCDSRRHLWCRISPNSRIFAFYRHLYAHEPVFATIAMSSSFYVRTNRLHKLSMTIH